MLAFCAHLSALAVDPGAPAKPVTVDQIYRLEQATRPPDGIAWSPDGTRLSYIDDKGDLVAVEGGKGTAQVLVDHDKMKALIPSVTSEHDLNNRTRYKEASYIWVPDSKHLLFDSNGQLWFFDLATGTGLQVASTGAGSGDDPKFSPDGTYLSYVREHNLYVRKLRDSNTANRLTDSQADTISRWRSRLGVRRRARGAQQLLLVAGLAAGGVPADERKLSAGIPHRGLDPHPRDGRSSALSPAGRSKSRSPGRSGGRQWRTNQVDQPAHRERKRLHPPLRVAQSQNLVDRDPRLAITRS